MAFNLTVAGSHHDLELLVDVASQTADVATTEPQRTEGSGEGQNFPLEEIRVAVDSLEVLAAAVSTRHALRQLLTAWASRRRSDPEPAELPEQDEVLISDIRTGTIYYRGRNLNPDIVESVVRAIETST